MNTTGREDNPYFEQARRYQALLDAARKESISGIRATSHERYRLIAQAYSRLGMGDSIDDVAESLRKSWSEFCVLKGKQVDDAPKIKHGPYAGLSVIQYERPYLLSIESSIAIIKDFIRFTEAKL